MKGIIRIGGAVLCGVALIAIAFYARTGDEAISQAALVIQAPEKNHIREIDADQNGTPDWEDEISKNIIPSVSASSTLLAGVASYTPPTTFTGKFAVAFFQDYMSRKGSGESFEDPTAFIDTAVEAIEQNTESKRHSRLELTIIPVSEESMRMYANEIFRIVGMYPADNSGDGNGQTLLKALQTNDRELIEKLQPSIDAYETMIKEMLAVPTPVNLIDVHLGFINGYEAVRFDLVAMKGMFEDPLFGLARANRYQDDLQAFFTTAGEMVNVFKANDISFSNEEAGALMYLFEQ